jgi:small subunit ribosomal protein S21
MSRIHPERLDSGPSDRSVAANVLLRQELDEKEEEDDNDDGYSEWACPYSPNSVLFGDQSHWTWTEGVSFNVCLIGTGLGVMRVAEVRLQDGESIDNALRRFKRKVQTENIIGEVKRHSYYLKPGERRRVKQALARKRARKKIRREPD